MFLLAVGIRLYNIHKPFVGLLPVREFRSAIIARDIYFKLSPDIPAWEREVTNVSRARVVTGTPHPGVAGGDHLHIHRQ